MATRPVPSTRLYRLINEGRYSRIEGGKLKRYSAPDELTLNVREFQKLESIVELVGSGVKPKVPGSPTSTTVPTPTTTTP